jgi:hypothetical protein
VTELQVFVAAMDDLFLIAAALSALSALGALLLRSGPAPAAPGFAAPQQETAPAASGNGGPTRPAEDLIDVRTDTSPRDT